MLDVEIRGLRETQKKLEQVIQDINGKPAVEAMRDATLWVQNDAKRNAPVDTGRLRNSITPELRTHSNTILGVVGSVIFYAPYQETGTRPHWPPLAALEVWARRHHTSAYVVARAIARRGNKGLHYLENAFRSNEERIKRRFEEMIGGIVKK